MQIKKILKQYIKDKDLLEIATKKILKEIKNKDIKKYYVISNVGKKIEVDKFKIDEAIIKIVNVYNIKIQKKAKLTDKAKNKIILRLSEFKFVDIVEAINNFSNDNWWMTNNSHRGIAWFFHTEDRIEQFINLKPKGNYGQFDQETDFGF